MINIESLLTSPDRKLFNLYRLISMYCNSNVISQSLKNTFGDILYDMQMSDSFKGDLRHSNTVMGILQEEDEIIDSRAVSELRMASKEILLSTFLSDSQNELIFRINKALDLFNEKRSLELFKDF